MTTVIADVTISYDNEITVELTHKQYRAVRPLLNHLENEVSETNKIITEQRHTIAELELYIHSLQPAYLGTRNQFSEWR